MTERQRPLAHSKSICAATIAVAAVVLIFVCAVAARAMVLDQPNILWITSEDNSDFWLGCYGNSQAQTPRIDALAGEGIRFTHCYSNAPVCAVARSTLLNGIYAVSQGTQHMRSRYPIPERFRSYVHYLRANGYYCTNQSKTDFNFRGNDAAIWDQCSRSAHYRSRKAGQPFFAVFNLTVSHESSLFPQTVAKNRANGLIPQSTRVSAESVRLPPYLPDLPEVRQDFAIYHDTVTAMDTQVGELLDQLKRDGLEEDTIVFYFSDHGGPTPRGKRYLKETGVRVPLIVRLPEKYRHLCSVPVGDTFDQPVSFVDFAPTILTMIGIESPPQMQGTPFLGEERVEHSRRPVLLYGDRFDEIIGMRRGLTDGRYKYIRRFYPFLPGAPYSYYPLSMPAWSAWQTAWQQGKLSREFSQIWQTPQPLEEFYDLVADPWETKNLVGDERYSEVLNSYRQQLKQRMIEVSDTGVIPEAMFAELTSDQPLADLVSDPALELPRCIEVAWEASAVDKSNVQKLLPLFEDPNAVVRYWATVAAAIAENHDATMIAALRTRLDDRFAAVRITAAQALFRIGESEVARNQWKYEFDVSGGNAPAMLWVLNAITLLGLEKEVPETWIRQVLADKQSDEYLRRFAERAKR